MSETQRKSPETSLVVASSASSSTSVREGAGEDVATGQWYWLRDNEEDDKPLLGCITHLGSNYAEFTPVGGYSPVRIHADDFDRRCQREPCPEEYIRSRVEHHQRKVNALLNEVKRLTAGLGITRGALSANNTGDQRDASAQALVAVHNAVDVAEHKTALIKAKKETLPELFKQVEEEHKKMAVWMKAPLLPYEAEAKALKKSTEAIDDRIFTVELYAGLVEKLMRIKDGDTAEAEEKVALFQRRHYMDEECLANYKAGGMVFKDLGAFDQWLLTDENLKRILPLPRCVVAFKVRRRKAERRVYNLNDFIKMLICEKQDAYTFLYIRNGEQVWRLQTEIEFDEQLFPSRKDSLLLGDNDTLWAEVGWSKVREIIHEGEYQAREAAKKKKTREYNAAVAAAKKEGTQCPCNPYFPHETWEKIDKGSVYYDDVMQQVAQEAQAHNRVAVVLQGILDRSPALHPHPPWQLWTQEGFVSGVQLIYDVSRALTTGEAPDFEEYRQRLNESIDKGSFTVGQELAWEIAEAVKENERRERDRRFGDGWHTVETYRPYGNPGPGLVAEVQRYNKTKRECTFQWMRERRRHTYRYDEVNDVACRFTCSKYVLLNVSAYNPGDFKVFYADPRTRADYAEWAPMLLAAEDWHHEQTKKKEK